MQNLYKNGFRQEKPLPLKSNDLAQKKTRRNGISLLPIPIKTISLHLLKRCTIWRLLRLSACASTQRRRRNLSKRRMWRAARSQGEALARRFVFKRRKLTLSQERALLKTRNQQRRPYRPFNANGYTAANIYTLNNKYFQQSEMRSLRS